MIYQQLHLNEADISFKKKTFIASFWFENENMSLLTSSSLILYSYAQSGDKKTI